MPSGHSSDGAKRPNTGRGDRPGNNTTAPNTTNGNDCPVRKGPGNDCRGRTVPNNCPRRKVTPTGNTCAPPTGNKRCRTPPGKANRPRDDCPPRNDCAKVPGCKNVPNDRPASNFRGIPRRVTSRLPCWLSEGPVLEGYVCRLYSSTIPLFRIQGQQFPVRLPNLSGGRRSREGRLVGGSGQGGFLRFIILMLFLTTLFMPRSTGQLLVTNVTLVNVKIALFDCLLPLFARHLGGERRGLQGHPREAHRLRKAPSLRAVL